MSPAQERSHKPTWSSPEKSQDQEMVTADGDKIRLWSWKTPPVDPPTLDPPMQGSPRVPTCCQGLSHPTHQLWFYVGAQNLRELELGVAIFWRLAWGGPQHPPASEPQVPGTQPCSGQGMRSVRSAPERGQRPRRSQGRTQEPRDCRDTDVAGKQCLPKSSLLELPEGALSGTGL